MNNTIEYYEDNAEAFASQTLDVNFRDVQDKFKALMKEDAYILDFGCGSGRDAKYFLESGFRVKAIDGSKKLCEIASKNTGIFVTHMDFLDLNDEDLYDGIWACSSILHLPKDKLKEVFIKIIKAIKTGGYFYTSFKYGDFEGVRNGRYFIDFTEDSFKSFLEAFKELSITELWVTSDARPGRESEKWLNLIMKKA